MARYLVFYSISGDSSDIDGFAKLQPDGTVQIVSDPSGILQFHFDQVEQNSQEGTPKDGEAFMEYMAQERRGMYSWAEMTDSIPTVGKQLPSSPASNLIT